MSLAATRLSFIHRCTVERDINADTDDGWGNPLPPDFEANLIDLPCRGWVAGHETVTDKGVLSVVIEVRLLVPVRTDVIVGDHVASITLRGQVYQDGPLAVRAVLPRRDHLELILAKAA